MKTLYEVDPYTWMIIKQHRYGHIIKQLLLGVPYFARVSMPPIHQDIKLFIAKEIGKYENIYINYVDVSHIAYVGDMSRLENRYSR